MDSNFPQHPSLISPLEDDKPARRFTQLNRVEDNVLTEMTDWVLEDWKTTRTAALELTTRAYRLEHDLEVETENGPEMYDPVHLRKTANDALRSAFDTYATVFAIQCVMIYNAYDRPQPLAADHPRAHEGDTFMGARHHHFNFKAEDGRITLLDTPEIEEGVSSVPSISTLEAKNAVLKYDDAEAFDQYLTAASLISRKSLREEVNADHRMLVAQGIMSTVAETNQKRKDTAQWLEITSIPERASDVIHEHFATPTHGHWEPGRKVDSFAPGRHHSVHRGTR